MCFGDPRAMNFCRERDPCFKGEGYGVLIRQPIIWVPWIDARGLAGRAHHFKPQVGGFASLLDGKAARVIHFRLSISAKQNVSIGLRYHLFTLRFWSREGENGFQRRWRELPWKASGALLGLCAGEWKVTHFAPACKSVQGKTPGYK